VREQFLNGTSAQYSYAVPFVRNTTLNFLAVQGHQVSVPLSQLCEPANVYALQKDHQYCEKQFLSNLGVTEISVALAEKIEKQTHRQSANITWHPERCVRLQASKFGEICKSENRLKLTKELVTIVYTDELTDFEHSVLLQ